MRTLGVSIKRCLPLLALALAVLVEVSCGGMPRASIKARGRAAKPPVVPSEVPTPPIDPEIIPEILSGLASYFQAGQVPTVRIRQEILQAGDTFSLRNEVTGGTLIAQTLFNGEGAYEGIVISFDPIREEWVFWLPPSVFESKGLLGFDGTGANQLRLGVLDNSGGKVVQADVNLYAFQAMTVMGTGFGTDVVRSANAEGYALEGWINMTDRPVSLGVTPDKVQMYLISGVGMMLRR